MAYQKAKKVGKALGDTDDCSVIALAQVLSVRYETAHLALEEAGRAFRDGITRSKMEEALTALGFRVRRRYTPTRLALEVGVKGRRPQTSDAMLQPEAWDHLPPLLLFTDSHVSAFVNGAVEDWAADRKAPIEEAWEVERVAPAVTLGVAPPPVVYL